MAVQQGGIAGEFDAGTAPPVSEKMQPRDKLRPRENKRARAEGNTPRTLRPTSRAVEWWWKVLFWAKPAIRNMPVPALPARYILEYRQHRRQVFCQATSS